jgi:hypothetical protein
MTAHCRAFNVGGLVARKLQQELDESVGKLRKDNEALRNRLEKAEADLRRVEVVQNGLARAAWNERVEQHYRQLLAPQ